MNYIESIKEKEKTHNKNNKNAQEYVVGLIKKLAEEQ